MLALPPRRLAPAFALSLLCLPLFARAQTPSAPPVGPQILLRVEYVMVDVDEANRLMPVSPSTKTEVQCLNGEISDKIYHSITRSQGSLNQCPSAVAFSNGAAHFQISTSPYGDLAALLPPAFFSGPTEAILFATPQFNQDHSITVTLSASAGVKDRNTVYWSCPSVTRTVRSGERLLLISPPIQKPDSRQEYREFMFVTPTVLESKAAAVDVSGSR